MIVAVTGHRPNKLGGYRIPNPTYLTVVRQLEEAILEHRPSLLITGMALGIDQWAAEICINNNIPFAAAIPCDNQECKWPDYAQRKYRDLLAQAHQQVVVCPGEYEPFKMHLRNEYMVNSCDLLIAVWDGTPGGTFSCYHYAEKVGKPIHRIVPQVSNPLTRAAALGVEPPRIVATPIEEPPLSRREIDEIFNGIERGLGLRPSPAENSFEPQIGEAQARAARRTHDRLIERLASGQSAPLPSEENEERDRTARIERKKRQAETIPYSRLVELDDEE